MTTYSNRTLEPGVTVFSASEIRVAIIPIGKVPKEVADGYHELINKYKHITLAAAQSHYRETQKSPFQHLPWQTGCLHFKYLQEEDARKRSKLVDLHAQRQVLALIGIVHCPASPDLNAAAQEFQKVCRQYPEVFTYRCFAFEPSSAQLDQDHSSLHNVVVFPPRDPDVLQRTLEVWMYDMAASVLTELEKWVLSAQPSMAKLNTYVDSGEFTGQLAVLEEVSKRLQVSDEEKEKRRWGRLQKSKGDMCLMAGSPRDGYDHYKSAMELAKVSGDAVFQAAALEGMAQARILEALTASRLFKSVGGSRSPTPTPASPEPPSDGPAEGFGSPHVWAAVRAASVEDEVRELLAEARLLYKKKGGVVSCQIEQHLKYSRFLAGLKGSAARREVLELVSGVMELLALLPLLEDRLCAVVEAAQVTGLLGSHRRRTLLLWHAVELARLVDKSDAMALRIAIKALQPPDTPLDDPEGPSGQHWALRARSSKWPSISIAALEVALEAARVSNSPVDAWEAAAALLREHHYYISPLYQASLLDAMATSATYMPAASKLRPGQGPGPVAAIKRVLPAPVPLQPVRLASGVKKGAQGPFIFNPYDAKRQALTEGQADSALPEWVAGDESRVEVLLLNPLDVALELDSLALLARYDDEPAQPLRIITNRRSSSSDGSSCSCRPYPIQVTLPPGGKPVRVVLALRPSRPGALQLLGCQCSAWGMQWLQPFVGGKQRPAPEGLKLKGLEGATGLPVTVSVLPALPTIRAVVTGAEVQASFPGEEEVSSHVSVSGAAQGSSPEQLRRAQLVQVLQGQVACWSLAVTNTSTQPISSCYIQVVNQKGVALKALGGSQLASSYVGVHAEVAEALPAISLPLQPKQSAALPVQLYIGKAPHDSFDDIGLEVRITYFSSSSGQEGGGEEPAAAATAAAAAAAAAAEAVGRRLSIPLRFSIQPTVQVTSLKFLEHHVPLWDGCRPTKSRLNLRDHSTTKDPALYRPSSSSLARMDSKLERHLSEGELGRGSQALQALDLSQAGGGSRPLQRNPSTLRQQAREQGEAGSRAGSHSPQDQPPSAAAASSLSMESECVMELGIRNCSERYFRTWASRLDAWANMDAAESAVEVLEPGADVRLLCALPAAVVQSLQPPEPSSTAPTAVPARLPQGREELSRMACAEVLAAGWSVCWEMITGDVVGDRLPRGVSRLAPVDVARALMPHMVSVLRPRQLHVRFSVPHPSVEPAQPVVQQLKDLTDRLLKMGIRPAHTVGQLWGLKLQQGDVVQLQVEVHNATERAQQLELSVGVLDLAESTHSSSIVASPRASQSVLAVGGGAAAQGLAPAGASAKVHPGVVLAGWVENVSLEVEGGAKVVHKFGAVMVQPGFYQFYVGGVRQVGERDAQGAAGSQQKLQVTVDPFNALCL